MKHSLLLTLFISLTGIALFLANPGLLYALADGDQSFLPIVLRAEATPTITPTSTPTPTPTIVPGLEFGGCVTLTNGNGVSGVEIYRQFASDIGQRVAITDGEGCNDTGFAYIPGIESVTVWAEHDNYSFVPGSYHWLHYYGYEVQRLDFVARP